ncbi:MAG TPA: uroporphyrinogen-III synthase, partial [Chitinophagaceae bacterium]|nr:uroporphyrinogen-III synthase [Chitinophagaceae bacterium]
MQHRVLSTKALPPELIARAAEARIEVTVQEFIRIEPLFSELLQNELRRWTGTTLPVCAVFTSANAVEATQNLWQRTEGATLPGWKVFCLSGKTRDRLTTWLPPASIAGTAETAGALAEKIKAAGVPEVVFFCGNLRRDELPRTLQEAGIRVQEVVVYETTETPGAPEGPFDALLFFSPSAVRSFFAANEPKKDTVCFAIGPTTAEALTALTRHPVVTSEAPRAERLV